jgi:hypothetical protein
VSIGLILDFPFKRERDERLKNAIPRIRAFQVEKSSQWESWRDALKVLETLRIPRTYVSCLSQTVTKELHVYADASEKAIAAGAYLRTLDKDGNPDLGFVLGKAKVAPTNGHTIPRLELCAAVLAVEIAQCALEQL